MDTRTKWNTKHKEQLEQKKGPTANRRLEGLTLYLNGGRALDIACGLGGNSFFLAKKNYQVQAVDISDIAITYIQEQKEKCKLSIDPQKCDLADLNKLQWPSDTFNLVVITYYLDRELLPIVKGIIEENGYFFMETYFQSPQNDQKISNQYKLRPQELLTEFKDWKILFYEENEQEGRQTIFCQNRSESL